MNEFRKGENPDDEECTGHVKLEEEREIADILNRRTEGDERVEVRNRGIVIPLITPSDVNTGINSCCGLGDEE